MTLEEKIDKLMVLAAEKDTALYAINYRKAGWGISWWEEARSPVSSKEMEDWRTSDLKRWKEGLVVYAYYPTIVEAVDAEIKRLEEAA